MAHQGTKAKGGKEWSGKERKADSRRFRGAVNAAAIAESLEGADEVDEAPEDPGSDPLLRWVDFPSIKVHCAHCTQALEAGTVVVENEVWDFRGELDYVEVMHVGCASPGTRVEG